MGEKYTIEEIQLAIDSCNKYKIEREIPEELDGMLNGDIETIEWKFFLHKLNKMHKNSNLYVEVKSMFDREPYKKWTVVSRFLACGLQGVEVREINNSFSLTWKNAQQEQPKEGGRYWCLIEEQNDLGKSHFQWNCSYNESENKWSDNNKDYNVIFWTELAPNPI